MLIALAALAILAGTVGAQYGVHDRFAIFGELGVQYSSQTTSSSFSILRAAKPGFPGKTG